ncbi:MAG: nuclear transport factor 2 family protein [Pseudobdellovibrionaceae bacterium]
MVVLNELLQQLSELPTTDLASFAKLYDEKSTLLTPMEEVKSRKQVQDYYERMRKDIQLKEFRVIDHILDEDRLCIRWESHFVKVKKPMNMLGISYAQMSLKSGLILSQVDYWNINLRSPWLNFAVNKLF